MAYFGENAEKKKVYSRNELEALRFEGIEEQKKKWVEVYCGFDPVVQKEYDELVNHNDRSKKKQQLKERKSSNSNPRHRNEKPSLDFGEESSQSVDCGIAGMDTVHSASNLDPINREDGCSVDLGDCMEADDSDGDYSIQKVAFRVKGEPDFDSGPPEDGLEYLRRVRWEAARIPKVKIAKIDRNKIKKEQTVYMPQIPDIVKCPDHLLPLKEWEDAFLADFSELRLVLSQFEMSKASNDGKSKPSSPPCEEEPCQPIEISIPNNSDMSDTDGSSRSSIIPMHETASDLVTETAAAVENRGSSSKECPSSSSVPSGTFGNRPTLSSILGMDAVTRVHMLRKHINVFETGSTFSKDQCSWLYALCAAVDTPLDADTSAALRSLLRKCASLRAEKSELNEEVVMLNMLATISGRYFGQSEN